jgi:hypothetical protein
MKFKILIFATIGFGLTCIAFDVDYKDLAAKGYRWVAVNGPYACTTEEAVQRITGHRTDATEVQMVEDGEAYYLIPGTIVRVVQNNPATSMSQIQLGEITRSLWTYTKFLSTRPIRDSYEVIETPENSGLIPRGNLGMIQLQAEESVSMPKPGPTPISQ